MIRCSVPIKMNLQLSSLNNSPNYNIYKSTVETLAQQPPKKQAPTALRAPMIERIFNVRPGCGSCGRG